MTASAILPFVISLIMSTGFCSFKLQIYSTPSLVARWSLSFTKSIKIGIAPLYIVACAIKIPMGPAPVITTYSPFFNFILFSE
ncbi:hypothetical protein ES708_31630 [subsurface metagenome]